MPQRKKPVSSPFWGVIVIALLAFGATYAIYLYYQPEEPNNDLSMNNQAAVEAPAADEPEEEDKEGEEWSIYQADEYSLEYPKDWYRSEEGDFITFTSWDAAVNPQQGEDGLRLVVGKVITDMTLEQYVADYLNQNINFDPSFSLLERSNVVFGGQPGIMVNSGTSLEGGSIIKSIFTKRGNELWSIDLVGRKMDDNFDKIFNNIKNNFSFN